MISDRSTLAGLPSYLTDQGGETDLASSPNRRGTTPDLGSGEGLDVRGIWMSIMAEDLGKFSARRDAPLLALHLRKELFPGLFADPYRSRVHTISGSDDLRRGRGEACRVLEIDGIPTLVATGPRCTWRSMVYALPRTIALRQACWALATSRKIAPATLEYSIVVRTWASSPAPGTPPDREFSSSGDGLNPTVLDPLHPAGPVPCQAFQVLLDARTAQDTAFSERHGGPPDADSLGRPLLQAVRLIEDVRPPYQFHSLPELNARSSEYVFVPEGGQGPPQKLMLFLDLPALLLEGERLEIEVLTDEFKLLEAWLDADSVLRMPQGKEG